METNTIPKGQSAERTEGQNYEPGIYKHKPTGRTFITSDGEDGITQANALMNPAFSNQWERIGDVPSRRELLDMNKAQQLKDAKSEEASKPKETASKEG